MDDLKKLNREVAEWAEFKRLPWGNKSWHYELTKKVMNWLYPDGTDHDRLPDFPDDLNACAKYVWPLLWVCDMQLLEGIFYIFTVGHPRYGSPITGPADENPALAFCLALEKLLGGKG